ncbi:hypothetical protein DFS34DRAFT_650094 [Phlyctochytrium arcticum]|nr:hypothetical protein DFS34DRAFT_650094 [Phlyctochytrium arcticum]
MTDLADDKLVVALMTILTLWTSFLQFRAMFETIIGGLHTTFVCFAEDPAVLEPTYPVLYEKIINACPDMQIDMMR